MPESRHCDHCDREAEDLFLNFRNETGWVCARCRDHVNEHGELPEYTEGLGDLVTDGGREQGTVEQLRQLVKEWEDNASMYGSHQRETFNARCEAYQMCAAELREVLKDAE
jgi:hypothetical protein